MKYFCNSFRTFLDNYSSTNLSNLIVVGDFNFPHIDWCTGGSRVSDPDTMEFCCLLQDQFLLQLNSMLLDMLPTQVILVTFLTWFLQAMST